MKFNIKSFTSRYKQKKKSMKVNKPLLFSKSICPLDLLLSFLWLLFWTILLVVGGSLDMPMTWLRKSKQKFKRFCAKFYTQMKKKLILIIAKFVLSKKDSLLLGQGWSSLLESVLRLFWIYIGNKNKPYIVRSDK